MYKKFESNILKKQLFSKQHKLLLAVSGGVDSVVLAHLLKKTGFDLSLAHCNFKLRGKESDADEQFCKDLAKKLDLEIFTKKTDVAAYSKKNKVSIQMAARKLRYHWFNTLLKKEQFSYLLTAHHANDVIETVFINLLRGTGVKGLKGIPEKKGTLVRPLLAFTKDTLEDFAVKEKIGWRLDKSNLESKYTRNFLRLDVLPLLKNHYPQLDEIMLNNIANFKEEAGIVNEFLQQKAKQLLSEKKETVRIDKLLLNKEQHMKTILHYLLKPFDFTATQISDIIFNLEGSRETGKTFHAKNYSLTIDRTHIVIKATAVAKQESCVFNSMKDLKKNKFIEVKEIKDFISPAEKEIIVERSRLIFPLTLRAKKTGERFKPFGMKGFKLLSDFLKDLKLNTFEKEECRVLANGNGEIIWVVGLRSDERYRVENMKNKLLKLSVVE